MKIFKFAIMFVVILLMACSTSRPATSKSEHQTYNISVSKKIYIDSEFNFNERNLIQKSADAWSNATNHIISYDFIFGFNFEKEYNDKIMIKKLTSNDTLTKQIDSAFTEQLTEENDEYTESKIMGYTLKKKDFEFIFIVADRHLYTNGTLDEAEFQNTVMHEMGHELGLSHYNDGPSIMNTDYEAMLSTLTGKSSKPITCITKIDAMQFCSLYLCDSEKLKHC